MPGTLVSRYSSTSMKPWSLRRMPAASGVSASVFGMRPMADSRCEPSSCRSPSQVAAGGLNPDRRRRGQDRDPVIAQDGGDLIRDVLVLDHHQAGGNLEDG